jgi:hypothetical protein
VAFFIAIDQISTIFCKKHHDPTLKPTSILRALAEFLENIPQIAQMSSEFFTEFAE